MKNRKDIMNNINLVFGLLLFVVFLITGYYMKEYFKPEHLNNIEQRLQIRSNHIYILFVSLLNITISICRFDKTKKSIYYLDLSLRILIVFTGILAFLAFCFEHTGEIDNRKQTLSTVILSLSSVGLLLLTELINRRKNKKALQQKL